jgi:cytochrome c oxidase subunit 2
MPNNLPFMPNQGSTIAPQIDGLYLLLVAICAFMTIAISGVVVYLALKYKRRPGNEEPQEYKASSALEAIWIAVPLVTFMAFFVLGAMVFFNARRMPDDAMDVWATGRQWMWKFQHPTGQSEINTLHVPVGRPIRLIMTSEDVIHDFFVPDFRVHTDVLPNRYTYNWFEATKTGRFHIFCSEYCGTEHSKMIGTVIVMEPEDYQLWLAGGSTEGSPATEGKKLFESLACVTCHQAGAGSRGPNLEGVFGTPVKLSNGQVVTIDENYVRESILNPQAKVVAGFDPIMPTFQGQLNEAQLMQLVSYIKSMKAPETPRPAAVPAPAAAAATK